MRRLFGCSSVSLTVQVLAKVATLPAYVWNTASRGTLGGSSSPRISNWPWSAMWVTIGANAFQVARNATACTPQAARAPNRAGRPARVGNCRYPRWCTRITTSDPTIARAPEPTLAQPSSVQPSASHVCQTARTGSVESSTASAMP
jgi:hypothetical protein